ncbi:hypothetical protein OF83DRAFT_825487 [Amylostereum chailletii]|nr:hypothetical protein OF83DRAFT_825487 [Amylostereum chailletii]
MATEIAEAAEQYNARAEALAASFNKRPEWMKKQLGLGAKKFTSRRAPSAWNGFVSEFVKEANEGLSAGEQRIHASKYMEDHADELRDKYDKLSKEEKENYKSIAAKAREERMMGMWLTSKSIAKDFNESFKGIVHEAADTCARTGGQAFVIATRGDAMHTQAPVIWATDGAESWMEMTSRGTSSDMALALEGFTVGGCAKEARKPKASKAAIIKDVASVRLSIQKGLDEILQKNKQRKGLKMNYRSYETKIVQVYRVALKGWPESEAVKNPGELGRKACLELKDALAKGTCKWETLSEEELKARKEAMSS